MKLVFPKIQHVFEISTDSFNQIILENKPLFRHIVADLSNQMDGLDGETVLSIENQPVPVSKNMKLISRIIPFHLTDKDLVSKVLAALDKSAHSPEFQERTARLLADLERYIDDLSFNLPGNVDLTKNSFSSLLKAVGIVLRDDYKNVLEKILDYMELVTVFEGEKCFVFINLRSYFSDSEMQAFTDSALQHGYHLVLIDNKPDKILSGEKRMIIDEDLCEF